MADLYDKDLDTAFQGESVASSEVTAPTGPVSPGMDAAYNVANNVVSAFNYGMNTSTVAARNTAEADTYTDLYNQVSKYTGGLTLEDNVLPESVRSILGVSDKIQPSGSEIAQYLSDNKDLIASLHSQGKVSSTYQDLARVDAEKTKSLRLTNENTNDGSWAAFAGQMVGSAGAYLYSDPIQTGITLAAGLPSEGLGLAANIGVGALEGAGIATGLEIRNKSGEVEARRASGEAITDEQAGNESLQTIAFSGAATGLGRGIGKIFTPTDSLKEIAQNTPEGIKPDVHTNEVLNTSKNIADLDIQKPVKIDTLVTPDLVPFDKQQDSFINNTINSLRTEDSEIVKSYDSEGKPLEVGSAKEELENYQSDNHILNTINNCLLGGG